MRGDLLGASSMDLTDDACERSEGAGPFVSGGLPAMTSDAE